MNSYVVYVPLRGVQVYTVLANSAKEAAKLVDEYPANERVTPFGFEITWHGKPNRVRLEAKDEG